MSRLVSLLLMVGLADIAWSQPARFFPQIATGESENLRYKTGVYFVNVGLDAQVHLEFLNNDGLPLELDLQPLGRAAAFDFPIAGGAVVWGETSGTEPLQVGYAQFTAPSSVGGAAVFSGVDSRSGTVLFEAGVPAVLPQQAFSVIVDSIGRRNTGLAVVAPSAGAGGQTSDASFAVTLYDAQFTNVGRRDLSLAPGRKIAWFIDEFFQGDAELVGKAQEMRGSATVTASAPLAAVTLRMLVPEQGFPAGVPALTAFPVVGGAASKSQWRLVWSDEFDGEAIDPAKWEHQTGGGGWGNNESQFYTNRTENSTTAGGKLIITAREESYGGRMYTSARLRTKNKGDWKFGRIEVRAKLPRGKGIWPAIWMMPTDDVYGTWAASGEIDIMEFLGHELNKVYGTLHYGGEWPNNMSSGKSFTLATGNFADEFRVFAIEWQLGEIRWYVDDELYQTQTSWHSNRAKNPAPFPAPFDQRFHLIMNVAVGGNWPGYPDATTQFPQSMEVDYVRVYQKPD
jgi:beta-glucanase (GH16 family)